MRIGIDACCWANARGYGRFTREVVAAMVHLAPEDTFLCFADGRAAGQFELSSPNVRLVRVELEASPTEAAAAQGRRSVLDMLRLTRAVQRWRPDVFFSPSVYGYFPLVPGQRAVVAVHDAIADRYPELTLPSFRDRLFWHLKVRLALRQARLVLTVSHYAARQIEETLGVSPARIRVAEEAPAPVFCPSASRGEVVATASRLGLPTDAEWFVYVGGFNPHKRVDVLVRAHAEVASEWRGSPPFLLLVGATEGDAFHGDQAKIRATIAECGTGDLVRWTGFLPDDDLRHVYSGALALVLPSESEGFGLPAVEAAACGAPVVVTSESPLPQLLEGGGIFVEPGDRTALSAALRRLLADDELRRSMGARALDRAASLSWSSGARVVLSALREAAA